MLQRLWEFGYGIYDYPQECSLWLTSKGNMIWNPRILCRIYAILCWSVAFSMRGLTEEISGCYGDTVTISCGTGDRKINILGDFYGLSPPDADPRSCTYSDKDVCVVPSHSHSSVAKQVCNGRTNCIFTISERHSCTNTVKETTYQQIKYECIPAADIHSMCTDAEWTGLSGFLTSANYPIFYPPRASCTCTLHTQDSSFILLKTAELRLKAATPCRDYLRVEPASNPEEVLCGSVHRIYEARSFTLYFHTQLTSYKGFMMSYEAGSTVNVRCFNGSPNTPTPPTTTINMTSPTSSQPQVHDITSPRSDSFSKKEIVIDSSGQIVKQEQTLSSSPIGQEVQNVSDVFKEPAGSQVSPTYPADLSPSVKAPVTSTLHTVSGCFGDIVHFQCKGGEMIRIVRDLYGSAPTGRCVYKQGDCAVEALGQKSIVTQICSSKTRCMNFIVTRTFCGERVTSYQEISYECVPATALTSVCKETVITSQQGFLASPNFPGMYPRNASCSCTMRAAQGSISSMVHLKLAHFALHDLQGCEDWLEVDLGDGNMPKTLCGSQHGNFSGSSIRLSFRSDGKYSHSGFWIHYKGENESNIVIACNVPAELVWPTTATITPPTTPTVVSSIKDTTTSNDTLPLLTDYEKPETEFLPVSTTGNYLVPPSVSVLPKMSESVIAQTTVSNATERDSEASLDRNTIIESKDLRVEKVDKWEEDVSKPIDRTLPETLVEPETHGMLAGSTARMDHTSTMRPKTTHDMMASAGTSLPAGGKGLELIELLLVALMLVIT